MWATGWSAPWRRAPFPLLRRPGVLATVAGASAVVVAALAAVPLFLSSAGTASIELQAAERCPRDTGVALVDPRAADVREARADPFVAVADRLGSTNRWTRLQLVPLAPVGVTDSTEQVTVLARDGALEHVDVVEGGDGAGVWLTDRAAGETGIGVGDRARLGGVEVPVAGVHRDLAGNSVDRFWCSNADLLLIRSQGADLVKPPPVVLPTGRPWRRSWAVSRSRTRRRSPRRRWSPASRSTRPTRSSASSPATVARERRCPGATMGSRFWPGASAA